MRLTEYSRFPQLVSERGLEALLDVSLPMNEMFGMYHSHAFDSERNSARTSIRSIMVGELVSKTKVMALGLLLPSYESL